MKAIYGMLGMVVCATAGLAQTAITLDQGEGYANDVFYSLSGGVVATVESGNWDLGYVMTPDLSFLVECGDNQLRALAFTGFTDLDGNKGTPSFTYRL